MIKFQKYKALKAFPLWFQWLSLDSHDRTQLIRNKKVISIKLIKEKSSTTLSIEIKRVIFYVIKELNMYMMGYRVPFHLYVLSIGKLTHLKLS